MFICLNLISLYFEFSAEGLQLLSRLESQLAVLKECEEDTRDVRNL